MRLYMMLRWSHVRYDEPHLCLLTAAIRDYLVSIHPTEYFIEDSKNHNDSAADSRRR